MGQDFLLSREEGKRFLAEPLWEEHCHSSRQPDRILWPQPHSLPSLGENAAANGNKHDASHRVRSHFCGSLPQYQLTKPLASSRLRLRDSDGALNE